MPFGSKFSLHQHGGERCAFLMLTFQQGERMTHFLFLHHFVRPRCRVMCICQYEMSRISVCVSVVLWYKIRERKEKTLTKHWRDLWWKGTHKHTEIYLKYFDVQRRLSQSEESECMWTHDKDGVTREFCIVMVCRSDESEMRKGEGQGEV